MSGPIEWRRYDGPIVLIEADHDPGDMGEPREFWDDDLKATCVVVPSLDFWWISPRSLRPASPTPNLDAMRQAERAARAAAPPVEPGCPECGLVGAHNPRCASQWNVPPSPVAGLREAADALVDEWDAAMRGDAPLDGHYQRQALERLRAALLDEPVPLDAASLREYIVANMHDGDDSGVMTAPTRSYVDETVEVVMEWIATRLTDPKGATDHLRGKDISMAEHSDTRSACPSCGEWRDSPSSDCAGCGYDPKGAPDGE